MAGRPVVVVAGNRDAPELFDALAPLLRDRNVHLIGSIRPPGDGGVLGPDALGVPAVFVTRDRRVRMTGGLS